MYCPNCNVLMKSTHCPICGSKDIREPHADDYCFLAEKELIWAGALADILKQNEIPYVTRNVLGAGLAARVGPAQERTRFYVPFADHATAQALEQEFFNADVGDMDFEGSTEAEE